MRKGLLTGVIITVSLLMVALPSASAAKYRLKVGVVTPTDHPHSVSSREFKKMVEERSGGRIKVKIFDSGKLGSNPELLDSVKTGIIDMCVNTPGVLAAYYPLPGILELPYLFTSKEHMMKVTRGPIGDKIANEYAEKTGVLILGYFGGAQRNMITREKKIESFDDMKGLKMRTWEWDVMLNWWKSLGTIGSVVAFPEVYTALQTGVVDGAENEFTTFFVARWAEVCKFIALTQHNITVRPIMIGKKKFNKLPQDLQEIVVQAAKDAADFDVNLEGELDQKNRVALEEKYGTIFTKPDKAPFIEKSLIVIREFAKEKNIETIAEEIIAGGK